MQRAKQNRTEQGLTMLETLVGIMVVGVIIFSVTPPLLFAFATRIHNYRVQNAMRIAQGEINRVRLVVQKGEYGANWTNDIPPLVTDQAGSYEKQLKSVMALNTDPSSNKGACKDWKVAGNESIRSWCTVDTNGDGDDNWDLAVQTFRSPTPEDALDNAKQPIAFLMGVRVYTRAAIEGKNLNLNPAEKTAIAAPGQSAKLPLVTHYELIVRSDLDTSRAYYCEMTQNLSSNNAANTCN